MLDDHEEQLSTEMKQELTTYTTRKREPKSTVYWQKICEERGFLPESEKDDGYESGLDPDLDLPMFKILLALNARSAV